MAKFPAICDSCGVVFPSAFVIKTEGGASAQVSLSGNKSGPCPSCGGTGSIPDGVYRLLGESIEVLETTKRGMEQWGRFRAILEELRRDRDLFREDVEEAIKKEAPEFARLVDLLPKTRVELYAFVSMLIAILALLLMQPSGGDRAPITVNQVINQIYETRDLVAQPSKPATPLRVRDEPGRNDSCSCGSGKKFKKCCGRG